MLIQLANAGDGEVNRGRLFSDCRFAPNRLAVPVAAEDFRGFCSRTARRASRHRRRIRKKAAKWQPFSRKPLDYSVDSISNPQASRRGSGMYLEFLLRRAHSRRRVERTY